MCRARDALLGEREVTGGKASLGGLAPLSEDKGREKAVGNCGFRQIKVIQVEWQTISVGWIIKYILSK